MYLLTRVVGVVEAGTPLAASVLYLLVYTPIAILSGVLHGTYSYMQDGCVDSLTY